MLIAVMLPYAPMSLAVGSTEQYETQNTAIRYFQYVNGSGNWADLLTANHWRVSDNAVSYCLNHQKNSPHVGNSEFMGADITDYFSIDIVQGLYRILEHGYPCVLPSGFTDEMARYATANAIRFWLSENGAPDHWRFTNRLENPNLIRAKPGYESLLAWADELVGYARNGVNVYRNISLSSSSLTMNVQGSFFVGTTSVALTNLNSYTLDQSGLPSGTVVEGFTGNSGDTLTIKIPVANGNRAFSLTVDGIDNRVSANMFMYVSSAGSVQNLITIDTVNMHPVAKADINMTTPAYGKIKVVKTDGANGAALPGAVFGIYSDSACTQELSRLTTGSDGTATSGDLMAGTYYVREITAPSPYVIERTVFPAAVTTATETITVSNTEAKGRITITKRNGNPAMGDYSLAGAKFGIYNASGTLVDTVTTGANGSGMSKELPLGNYTVKESLAPHGFVLSDESRNVPLVYAGQTVPVVYADVTMDNFPQTGRITVTKNDAETGATPQGDASLFGARYVIKDAGGNVVDTLHALGTRVVTSKPLKHGSYTVTETQAPEGYLLNPTAHTVTLSYEGQNEDVTEKIQAVSDTVKKGRIRIVKFGAKELTDTTPDPDIKPPLAGVTFEIRLKSTGALYDTLVTDTDGMALSKPLPYGMYTVTETGGAPEGYMKVQPFDVPVYEDGETYHYNLEDKSVELMVRLVKKDADTGKTIPVAGTTFRIENSAGGTVSFDMLYPQPHRISEFVTDSSGTIWLPGKLANGQYKLIEVQAPSGYTLNNAPMYFTVREDIAENGLINVTFADKTAMGRITVIKTGEQLTGTAKKETPYGVQYIPVYQNKGLSGVVFEVFAAENVGTPDGTVYYRAGQKVCEVTTGADGRATTPSLYLGKYNVVEKYVPSGFLLDDTPHVVTLEYAGQATPVVTESVSMENRRQKAEIRLKKMAEYFDEDTGAFYENYGKGFVFGVYAKEAIGDIPANALVDVITTAKDGTALTTSDLPLAVYYLKELATPYGYTAPMLNLELDLTSKNSTSRLIINDDYVINLVWNRMIKRRVAVVKADAENSERKLPGAVFDVLNANRKVVATITTDDIGYGVSGPLPLGEYVLREREAPTGFILSDEETPFVLTAGSSPITRFDLDNTANTVKLSKSDVSNGKPIEGAIIIVEDEAGEVVFAGRTDGAGTVTMRELPVGTYTFRETISPSGWALNTGVFTFTVDEYGVITGDTEIEDEPTTIIVEKRDASDNRPMPGVIFTLRDADGDIVKLKMTKQGCYVPSEDGKSTFTVGRNGKAVIKYARCGEYTLMEKTPEGYLRADGQKLTVTDDYGESSPLTVIIYNTPISLLLRKTNSVTGTPLTGAGFAVVSPTGEALTFTSQEDGSYRYDPRGIESIVRVNDTGEAVITHIPAGEYTLEEKEIPAGFAAAQPVNITVTDVPADETPVVVVENEPTKLLIWKHDALTGERLRRRFRLLDIAGNAVKLKKQSGGEYTPDPDGWEFFYTSGGTASIQYLPHAQYTIVEETHAGYAPLEPVTADITAAHGLTTPLALELLNAPLALRIEKVDANTGQAMTGVSFAVISPDGKPLTFTKQENGTYRCDPKGEEAIVWVDDTDAALITHIPAGDYTLEEKDAPVSYVLAAPTSVTVTDEHTYDAPCIARVENEPTKLLINKKDAMTGQPMNATFRLMDGDGNTVPLSQQENGGYYPDPSGQELFQAEEGTASILYLSKGQYTIAEETQSGYVPLEPVTVDITDKHGISTPLTAELLNIPTGLKVFKVHAETGERITGAGFTIKVQGALFFDTLRFSLLDNGWYRLDPDGSHTQLMVDDNGELRIAGLPLGDVWLEESAVPEGFFPNPAVKLEITADHSYEMPLEVTVKNSPAVKLGIDSDKYDPIIAIGLCLVIAGFTIARFVALRKKKKSDQ